MCPFVWLLAPEGVYQILGLSYPEHNSVASHPLLITPQDETPKTNPPELSAERIASRARGGRTPSAYITPQDASNALKSEHFEG